MAFSFINKHNLMSKLMVFVILTALGILYQKYKSRYEPDHELSKHDLIQKFLLNKSGDMDTKPILWIHSTHEVNARIWDNFGSRNSIKLNQPYILSCIETIVKYCGKSFNICLVDDTSFKYLIPDWDISVRKLPDPIRSHIRAQGIAKLLYTFGGLIIPNSCIVLKDLEPLYTKSMKYRDCLVGEILNSNILDSHMLPTNTIMGCTKNSSTMMDYVKYLEGLNVRDNTSAMDFKGDAREYLYKLTESGSIIKIEGGKLGAVDSTGKAVTLERLMGTTYVDFVDDMYALYLPSDEILSRTKYEWFTRLSHKQLLECPSIATKWLLVANGE
jgi:hypothetical protein